MIDWESEVNKRKDLIINDLVNWIKIPSIYEQDSIKEKAPFGQPISNSLNYMIDLAKRDGFNSVNDEGYAIHIDLNNVKDKMVGILGHADVVAAGDFWKVEAFSGEIMDNNIFGRGCQDNKGPMIAAYHAMKIIKDLNLPLKNQVRMIVGGDEELEWRCLEHYFKNYPRPDFGFTPDGDFPVIYAEKGIVKYEYYGTYLDNEIIEFKAGISRTSIPDSALVVVKNNNSIKQIFESFCLEHKVEFIIKEANNLELTLIGKAAHAASPFRGVNAAVKLMEFISENYDNKMFKYFAKKFQGDYGEGLGISFNGDKMGFVTSALTLASYQDNNYSFIIDSRYPLEIDVDWYNNTLLTVGQDVSWSKAYSKQIAYQKGIYLDTNSTLIKTLLNAYQTFTNDKISKPICKGGDTYARASKNIVCFGMLFQNTPDLMHQANESVPIDELLKATAIYAKAIYDLANLTNIE